jgi:hypothetical protein
LNKNNQLVSSEGIVGGTKDDPRDLGDGIFIQEDNVAVEYNIPPCNSADELVHCINLGLTKVQKELDVYGYKIAIMASGVFDPEYIYTTHGLTMGCEPDYSVYTGKHNDLINSNTCLRSCGGHIHIGYDSKSLTTRQRKISIANIVRAMDLFLCVPSMLLDSDTRRRELYGKPGSFRVKNYGLEYRSLSNFWIGSEELIRWVWDQTVLAFEFSKIESNMDFIIHDEHLILKAINENDSFLINNLCQKYGIQIPTHSHVIQKVA